jgi:hypothetical protein
MDRVPWTFDDLEYLIPKLEKDLDDAEEEQKKEQLPGQEEVKPLPPMTEGECIEYFNRLLDAAGTRALTARECFLHGQLLAQFKQASIAAALGKKGRFYVISENDIAQMLQR